MAYSLNGNLTNINLLTITVGAVLTNINPKKTGGLDGIPAGFLRNFNSSTDLQGFHYPLLPVRHCR